MTRVDFLGADEFASFVAASQATSLTELDFARADILGIPARQEVVTQSGIYEQGNTPGWRRISVRDSLLKTLAESYDKAGAAEEAEECRAIIRGERDADGY